MAELLFYERVTPIDKDKHRHLRIGEIRDYAFTAKTNSVPLTTVEFFEAAREYPIVFAGDAAAPVPAALLGLRSDENLFVDAAGTWRARYIPAFVRRYPFVPAPAGEQLLVCIDEQHPAVGDPTGQALFTQDGQPTPFLQTAIQFMRQFQAEAEQTRHFMLRLKALGLLQEVAARAELKSGGSYQLNGFSVVNEARYRALDKDTVDELFRKGWLALIDAHLLSLGNLDALVDRLSGS
ncbi:MAG: SapC family protein [Rhodocyclaceae bacterium]|nr:MAG: SapC family protein [Rhodocyclaceae bacterium]